MRIPSLLQFSWLAVAASVTATCLWAADAAKRAPVPDEAAQAEATKLLKEVYGGELAAAKTADQKKTLAKKLLDKAVETADDLTSKFVLLKAAKAVAMQAVDAEAAFETIDKMAESFDVNALEMKTGVLNSLQSKAHLAAEHASLAELALGLVDQAMADDKFESAAELANLGLSEARKARNGQLLQQAHTRLADCQKQAKAFEEQKAAQAALDKTPDDPQANLDVGKYLCFTKGDWERGMPKLALGKDDGLKALAMTELQGVASSTEEAKLGDGWWDLAEKQEGTSKTQMRQRAGYWYQKALPGLSGLMKDKVEKRLALAGGPSHDQDKGSPPIKSKTAPAKTWRLVFRSDNPEIWNTDVEDSKSEYAIPITQVPDDIKYLRLQIDRARAIIIPMTKEKLLSQGAEGRFRWQGTNSFRWGGHHLGVFDMNTKETQGGISIGNPDGARLGWGFGHRHGLDDRQGYSWAAVEIPKSVFEIWVKSVALTRTEQAQLIEAIPPKSGGGDLTKTEYIGSTWGGPYEDLPDPRCLLVGFNYTTITPSGKTLVVRSVQPIYLAGGRASVSRTYGKPEGQPSNVEAKKGYAVAGLVGKGGTIVDGFKVIFMRMGKKSLDAGNSYESEWIGGPGGGEEKKLGADGRPVVGIYGHSGSDLNGLGLIQAK